MAAMLVVRASCSCSGALLTQVSQPIFFIWFSAEQILLFLRQDPEVAHLAAVYLRWVSLGLPGMHCTISEEAQLIAR